MTYTRKDRILNLLSDYFEENKEIDIPQLADKINRFIAWENRKK